MVTTGKLGEHACTRSGHHRFAEFIEPSYMTCHFRVELANHGLQIVAKLPLPELPFREGAHCDGNRIACQFWMSKNLCCRYAHRREQHHVPPVPYTHLTLPTNREVSISGVAVSTQKTAK